MVTIIITAAAAKARYNEIAFLLKVNAAVYALRTKALRDGLEFHAIRIAAATEARKTGKVMIAEYEEQWLVKAANDIFIVGYVQVSRSKHAVNISESIPYVERIDKGINMVGNRHDVQPLINTEKTAKNQWGGYAALKLLVKSS